MTANDKGPKHYKRLSPEPWDVVDAWGLDYFTGTVLKYISRAGHKPGAEVVEDLRKAVHFLEKRIEILERTREPELPEDDCLPMLTPEELALPRATQVVETEDIK